MSKISPQINGLPVIHTRAAGIDIGSRFHVVAVPANLSEDPVQTFQAFTADIQRMTDWLAQNYWCGDSRHGIKGGLLGARFRDSGKCGYPRYSRQCPRDSLRSWS